MVPMKATALGEIMQIAFVPQDFDAALQHWLNMGAGPFFVFKDKEPDWTHAFGREIPFRMDVALGNWGELQIELIRQKCAGRTIYSDWYDAKKEGVHHTCIRVADMAAGKKLCLSNGFRLVHEGGYGRTEWAYFDTHGGDGTLLEIVCTADGGPGFYAVTRDAARNWDGRDPIRFL